MITFTFHRHVCLAEKNRTPGSIGPRATTVGLTSCPTCFIPGKDPSTRLKLDGPESWFGRFGEEKNLLPPLGFYTYLCNPWT